MHLVVDIQILRNILRSNSFFASTSILVLTEMITVFRATERSIDFVQGLPFPASVSYELWQIMVLILVVVFICAFSKYGWAMRQLNHCSIMIGAIVGFESVTDAGRSRARNTAVLATTASTHTSRGISASYLGLVLLTLHTHPIALMACALTVALVLYRREFHSWRLQLIRSNTERRDD